MIYFIALLLALVPMIPATLFLVRSRTSMQKPAEISRRLTASMIGINIVIGLMILVMGTVWLLSPATVEAAGLTQEAAADPYRTLAAAIAVSVGSISAGYAVSTTGSAAVGAIAEKPEVFGRALIFVGLAEGVAIYGLIIAFIILGG
ncbi:MAG: ATP synthase subunit C [Anaerolineae bacterium]|nr:ATP synthase subunit C [Anaerolineae bacterium]